MLGDRASQEVVALEAHLGPAAVEAFGGRVLNDAQRRDGGDSAALGDRLGLFRIFPSRGSAIGTEFAIRNGLRAAAGVAGRDGEPAGYLSYDSAGADGSALPPNTRPRFARENGPLFSADSSRCSLLPLAGAFDRLAAGRSVPQRRLGVPQSAFLDEDPGEGWSASRRFWFENHLIPSWTSAMPEVKKKLRAGADVAGSAAARVARPGSSWRCAFRIPATTGTDSLGHAIALLARKNARMSGVADRVSFRLALTPGGLAVAIRRHHDLRRASRGRASGRLSCEGSIERPRSRTASTSVSSANCSENLMENAGLARSAALRCVQRPLYRMTTSLAAGGEGPGAWACWNRWSSELGAWTWASPACARVPIEDPFQCPLLRSDDEN